VYPAKLLKFIKAAGCACAKSILAASFVKPVSKRCQKQVGDYTIIHAGFALNILSEEEANLTLEALRELADINAELNVGGQEDFTGYEVK
jgi:hydrogenase assembly chaperone HypC/HupF